MNILADITPVIIFGLHLFLPRIVRQQGFKIMDMKKYTAIPLNVNASGLRQYSLLYDFF